MSTPLGFEIGNSLEVKEALDILKGKDIKDLKEISIALSAEMISLSLKKDKEEAITIANEMINSGKAYQKFLEMVKAQGGDISYIEDSSLFLKDVCSYEVKADKDGYIYELDALTLGKTSVILGAGRNVKTDKIDYNAGILLAKKQGDRVFKNDIVMTLYSSNKEKLNNAKNIVLSSFEFSDIEPINKPLILNYIT